MRGEEFRSRRFTPVAPGLRPRRTRAAVRVVVTDDVAVLTLADSDPGLPGSRWYVTPGGGIDGGESEERAALRELEEETGLVLAPADLLGPVLRRTVVHGYSDQILVQSESFYVVRTPRFTPDVSGHTEQEQLTLQGHAWIDIATLAEAGSPVWPGNLPEILAAVEDPGRWPLDGGTVEESTVAVGQ